MKIKIFLAIWLLLAAYGCKKDHTLPIPSAGPNSILSQTHPLKINSKLLLEGVYNVSGQTEMFGDQVIVKNNRTNILIANRNGKYIVLESGYLDSVVFLQGYWRNGYGDETGLVSLMIGKDEGGTMVVTGTGTQNIVMRGAFGNESNLPDKSLVLSYSRPFSEMAKNSTYHILAHRGGGRTSDLLPVSENSIAMVGFTERLGSTGIEIDVRLSKDSIPFLYHDGDLNIRLTQKGPLAGPPENFTLNQLKTFVRLIHGETIPSLEELLQYTIDSTLLSFVYMDMKGDPGSVSKVVPIQKKMLERAAEKGRDIIIVMGIPNDDVLNELLAYPDYTSVPSLCELTVDDVRKVDARVWAPRWTLGTQDDLVAQMHAEGRLAVTWTIDQPSWIRDYINEGQFDGLLTNFPYVVSYYHYIQQ